MIEDNGKALRLPGTCEWGRASELKEGSVKKFKAETGLTPKSFEFLPLLKGADQETDSRIVCVIYDVKEKLSEGHEKVGVGEIAKFIPLEMEVAKKFTREQDILSFRRAFVNRLASDGGFKRVYESRFLRRQV